MAMQSYTDLLTLSHANLLAQIALRASHLGSLTNFDRQPSEGRMGKSSLHKMSNSGKRDCVLELVVIVL